MVLALALGASAQTTGCLVADAPTYGPPQQRPPVINFEGVTPSPYARVLIDDSTPSHVYTVPVRSEDAGEPLVGTLVVDWQQPNQQQVHEREIPASSFDDDDRSYQVEWRPNSLVTRECGHTLTALIMHKSNFDDDTNLPKPNVEWDIASVTWQLNVYPDEMEPDVIGVCPTVGPGTN
jgi:hypothetical protein